MKVEILSQSAGAGPIYERIKGLVSGRPYTFEKVRILMALARWSGIGLLSDELKDFVRRKGHIEIILGTDLGGTTPEVLSYLLELAPNGALRLFGAENATFHPKVLIFKSRTKVVAIIGSSNLTGGGMAVNFEVDVLVELDPTVPDDQAVVRQLEALWQYYSTPSPPLVPGNIIRIDRPEQIEEIASRLGAESRRAPDERPAQREQPELFPRVDLAHLPRVRQRPPIPSAETVVPAARVPEKAVSKAFYMQVLRETGPDGAQVQVPVDALGEFFGVGRADIAFIKLYFPDGKTEHRQVLHFANNTHRIQIAHLAASPRPLMIRLMRRQGDNYRCDVAMSGSKLYNTWLALSDRQTRSGSKHWGIG